MLKPGIYKSDGKVRCFDCNSILPMGAAYAVTPMSGAVICDLHRPEFFNAMLAIDAYNAIKRGASLNAFKPGLIDEVKAVMWIFEDKTQ